MGGGGGKGGDKREGRRGILRGREGIGFIEGRGEIRVLGCGSDARAGGGGKEVENGFSWQRGFAK